MPYVEINPSEIQSSMGKCIPISEEEANKAKKPPSIWSKVKELPGATGETILSLGTGLVAYPIGLAAQGEALILGYSPEEARKIREFTSELYTYKPVTEAGAKAAETGGKIVSVPFYPAEKGREYAVKKWGPDIGETIGLGLEAATIGILGGLTARLKGKTKPTTFPTEEEWAELKQRQLEYKPKVEPKTLEVPIELETKALPSGEGKTVGIKPKEVPGLGEAIDYVLKVGEKEKWPLYPQEKEGLEKLKPEVAPKVKVEGVKPPVKPLAEEKVLPEALPVSEEGVEKPLIQTFRKYTESQGIKWGEFDAKHPQYPELKTAWDILKSEKGAIQLPTLEEIKRVTNRFREFWSPFSTLPQKENLLKIRLGNRHKDKLEIEHLYQ